MVNQQNALRTAAAQGLGGAPLILSHHARLQMPSSVTTTIAGTPSAAHVTAAGLINGSLGMKNIFQTCPTLMSILNLQVQNHSDFQNFDFLGQQQPPPLIAPGDTSGLLYAQYASALQNADYAAAANYSGLMSPLLAAEYAADPTGGLFAR